MPALAWRGALAGAIAAAAGSGCGFLSARADASFGQLLAAVTAGFLGGGIVGLAGLYHPARTVRAVGRAANRVAAGDLAQRVEGSSAATDGLASSFNQMASRLASLVEGITAEHARLVAVLDASADPTIALARDTSLRFLNRAAANMFSIDREAARGRAFIEVVRDYELDALVRRELSGQGGDARVITFGRDRVPVRALAMPIPGGGDWAVLLVLSDLTELQRLDQVRRDFLGNVSHELRTPLASIKALVETLESGPMEPVESAEFLRRIHEQVDRLSALVAELLDLSRIEWGAIELRPEAIELGALVGEAVALLRMRSQGSGVEVRPAGPALSLEGDRASILRIITNLLDNAIKYSPRGSMVRVEWAEQDGLARLAVIDEGPGIAVHDLPRVFERFYKGDASRAGAGVGLGLAIVKHLVRAHGGTVEAGNSPGGGAMFTLHLPQTFAGQK